VLLHYSCSGDEKECISFSAPPGKNTNSPTVGWFGVWRGARKTIMLDGNIHYCSSVNVVKNKFYLKV